MLSLDKNSAYTIMDGLGRQSCLHFVDVNSKEQVYNRTYSNTIRRADESQRRIKYIETLYSRSNVSLIAPPNVNSFINQLQSHLSKENQDAMAYFEKAEEDLHNAEKFLSEQQRELENTSQKYTRVLQQKYVLNKASKIILSKARY